MKTSIALCLVLVAAHATTARADTASSVDLHLRQLVSAPRPDLFRPDLERRAHRARKLRNVGIAMTVVGTVVSGVGTGLIAAGYHQGNCDLCGVFDVVAGGVVMSVGAGALLAGIPMWSLGASREKALRTQLSLTASGVVGRF